MLFRKIISFISGRRCRNQSPVMEAWAKKQNGQRLQGVRISTSTFINCPEKLMLGNDVFIGHHNFIEASNGISIGEGCQITNFVSITTHSSHIAIRLYGKNYTKSTEHKGYAKGNISIGNYTFIGPHSTIMPNAVIGKGCIVAAHSYVDGTFPDFSVIKGNPAIVVGDTRTIDKPFLEQYPELLQQYNEWSK